MTNDYLYYGKKMLIIVISEHHRPILTEMKWDQSMI